MSITPITMWFQITEYQLQLNLVPIQLTKLTTDIRASELRSLSGKLFSPAGLHDRSISNFVHYINSLQVSCRRSTFVYPSSGLPAIMLFGLFLNTSTIIGEQHLLFSYSSSPLPSTLAFVHHRYHETHTWSTHTHVHHRKTPIGKQKASTALRSLIRSTLARNTCFCMHAWIHSQMHAFTTPQLTLLKHFLHLPS